MREIGLTDSYVNKKTNGTWFTIRTNLDKIDWKLTKPEVRLRKTLLFQNFVQIETSVRGPTKTPRPLDDDKCHSALDVGSDTHYSRTMWY